MRRARAVFCGWRRNNATCTRSVLWEEAQNCDNLRLLAISRGYVELQCVMAARSAKTLPSDPEYLLSLMSQIGEDSESDDEYEFDGWLDDHREQDDETIPAPRADVQSH